MRVTMTGFRRARASVTWVLGLVGRAVQKRRDMGEDGLRDVDAARAAITLADFIFSGFSVFRWVISLFLRRGWDHLIVWAWVGR